MTSEKQQQWSSKRSIIKQFHKCIGVGLGNTSSTLFHLHPSLIALCENTSCYQVLQKKIVRWFFKIWWQLIFLRRAIRKIQRWGKVLVAEMSLNVIKLVYRWPLITSSWLYWNKFYVLWFQTLLFFWFLKNSYFTSIIHWN